MFCFPCRRTKKKDKLEVEPGADESSSPQRSAEENPKPNAVVPDTPSTSATTVSAPPEVPKGKAKKTSWWRRRFSHKKKAKPVKEEVAEDTNQPPPATEKNSVCTTVETEGEEAGVQEAPPTPDSPVSSATETRNQNLESPAEIDEKTATGPTSETVEVHSNVESTKTDSTIIRDDPPTDVSESTQSTSSNDGGSPQAESDEVGLLTTCDGEAGVREASPTPDSPVSSATKSGKAESRKVTPSGLGGKLQAKSDVGLLKIPDTRPHPPVRTKSLSRKERDCLGLPNLGQTCYMNSTLQSLLTLTPFVQEVHNQEWVWSSYPISQLFRGLVEVAHSRLSADKKEKERVLAAFKDTVSEFNSEFEDGNQKDAYEFLSCVLSNLSVLSNDLHAAAFDMGLSYTCPVNAHIGFQMLNTRTCKGCGMQFSRSEDYMNLFLDLVPEGSVSQCLQDCLKETQVEYHCDCGAEESSQQSSFLTLPNILILQLKRFTFTESFRSKKLSTHVVLSKELMVNTTCGIIEETRYSLVSIISHLGSTTNFGHYICDGVYRPQHARGMADHWFTYNDDNVKPTTTECILRQRQRTAYLLFYEKQEEPSTHTQQSRKTTDFT